MEFTTHNRSYPEHHADLANSIAVSMFAAINRQKTDEVTLFINDVCRIFPGIQADGLKILNGDREIKQNQATIRVKRLHILNLIRRGFNLRTAEEIAGLVSKMARKQ